MEKYIRYIELKTGFSNRGPAWIGKVEFSKSGQTIYFNGKAFKKNDWDRFCIFGFRKLL